MWGKHNIKGESGAMHTVEEYGWDKEKVYICIDGWKFGWYKMYFRHERTWDDHMGNTPCGYYANIPIEGKRKRVDLNLYH